MRSLVMFVVTIFGLFLSSVLVAQETVSGEFEKVKMKTFDGEKFIFPSDMRGIKLNIVFLGMSNDQDNGQLQQEQLLEWQAALEIEQVFSDSVMAYHFPAMNSPPFFVKGIIANAMSESYQGKVSLSQAGVMYLGNLDEFADSLGLQVDSQPTIVIADGQGNPLKFFKGSLSELGLIELVMAIRAASGEPEASVEANEELDIELSEALAE